MVASLIIKENHCCNPGTRGKMRRTLPLGNFQKKRRRKKQVQTLPTGRTQILVLVKGDHQKGSQFSPTTQILVLDC
jgi:hypothetical protein